MTVMLAILFPLLATQDPAETRKADRAVVVRAKGGGSRIEIKDPAVIRDLETALSGVSKPPAPEDGAWTLTFYFGDAVLREVRIGSTAAKLGALLRDLERIEPLCRDLGSDDEGTRVRATRALTAIGRPALEALKRLADAAKDAEVKFRATQIVREIQAALRPRVAALFFYGRKEKGTAAPFQVEDWVRKAAAEQGFDTLTGFGYEWTEIPLTSETLFPAAPSRRPGGVYVRGQIVEWTIEGSAVIDLACTVKSWKQGKFSLDAREPRKLVRLSEQQPADDLFVALKILE